MIDSKKRLEKILEDYIVPYDSYGIDFELQKEEIKECSNLILKEFIHKKTLPNIIDIEEILKCHENCRYPIEDKKILAGVIQKLIEGKK